MEKISLSDCNIRCHIVCRGKVAECGRQYGEAARQLILQEADLFGYHGKVTEGMKNFAGFAARSIRDYAPEVFDELEGIAAGSGVPLEVLLTMNVWESVAFKEMPDRCTTFLLHDREYGMITAKNNDGPEYERETAPFVLREVHPDKGIPFIQVTYAGWLSGLDMMNSEGLANTHGSVGSILSRNGNRLDIRLQCYKLMKECRSVPEFCRRLTEVPLTGKGFSIAAADRKKNNAIVEAAVPQVIIREKDADFAFSTNLYCSPELAGSDARTPEAKKLNSCRREFLEKHQKPQTLEDLKSLMHTHGEFAPCRHGSGKSSSTFWSMIALPETGKVLISPDAPCKSGYIELNI